MSVANEQVNLQLAPEVVERLRVAAKKYNRRNHNQVAAEVVETFLEFWEAAEAARMDFIKQQRALIVRKSPKKS